MLEPERDVLDIAAHQYAVVSRAQALERGMTIALIDRRVKQGRFEVVLPGVYRMPGSPRTGRQRAMAACLWLGSSSLVSHLTAATLLRLDGCKTTALHFSVPRENRRRTSSLEITVHRVLALPRCDRIVLDGIPCTSATRTLIDCAGLLDDEALEVAFESARRMGLTSARALSSRATSRAMQRLLAHQAPGEPALQYRLEVKMARLWRASGLPRPERQYPIGPYYIDFALPDCMVGVECEGFEYHGSRLAWKRDKARTAWIEAQGWRLVFVTWDDVTRRPDQTLDRVALALTDSRMPL